MRSAYGWGKGEGGGLKEDCDDLMVALRVKTTCEVSMGGGWRVGLKEDGDDLMGGTGTKNNMRERVWARGWKGD